MVHVMQVKHAAAAAQTVEHVMGGEEYVLLLRDHVIIIIRAKLI